MSINVSCFLRFYKIHQIPSYMNKQFVIDVVSHETLVKDVNIKGILLTMENIATKSIANGSKNILLLISYDNVMSRQYVIIIKTTALIIAPTIFMVKSPLKLVSQF